ncbi:MAG: MerR family transcriptional regulator [Candidatus Cyclobacteriaceae bacterium M3_2C_046]
MPYKEKAITKKYYSIGEVASLLNVTPSLIRFWETEFDIIKPKKNRKGNRQFTQEDIENIRIIYHLVKDQGYTLQGAREILKRNTMNVKEKMEMIESLKHIKQFLIEIRSQLPE